MGKTILIVSVVVGVVTLLLGRGTPAMAGGESGVTIDAPAEVAEDSDITARVNITDATAFDAGQFDVSFNEEVLRLDNVTAGLIGTTQIPVDLWNETGTGTYRIIVNVPGVPGVSGSGYLATLSFHVIGSAGDSSAVDLSNGFLNNNLTGEIAATWAGDSVTVNEEVDNQTSPVPKHVIAGSLGAVGMGGLAGYFWLRRRKVHKA